MFFSTELLSRRDSGFGLIWLAATLGAKSSFKKLPRKSVLTADISQLCQLIAEPLEPLALRLSSNLMVGVVRVYKVKQEMLLADVSVCFNILKKTVSEMHTVSAGDLQMGQPTVRPDTVTVAADPTVAFAMDFDHLFLGWDDRTQATQREGDNESGSDAEFDPTGRKAKKKARAKPISGIEQPRVDMHILKETHEFMYPSSFDHGNNLGGGIMSSSSQFGGFGFNDDLIDISADISDELARELGEGWGAFPAHSARNTNVLLNEADIEMGEARDNAFEFPTYIGEHEERELVGPADEPFGIFAQGSEKRFDSVAGDGMIAPEGSIIVPLSPLAASEASNNGDGGQDGEQPKPKKTKHVRLLLDARTELTTEELERARTSYMERQSEIRREIEQKKAEKDVGRMLEEMMWGAPCGINAPVLVDFWLENFKLQVEARSGQLRLDTEGLPPRKRRRIDQSGNLEEDDNQEEYPRSEEHYENGIDGNLGMDFGMNIGADNVGDNVFGGDDWNYDGESRLRSSEEPGQGRRASRPPSLPGSGLDFAPQTQEFNLSSQRSNLFPWDNAGVSSSISGVVFGAGRSDKGSIGGISGTRKRGSSLNRESPLARGIADSPASFGLRGSQLGTDAGFDFDIPEEDAVANESQRSDASALTLERNSFNFLEYAKMQLQAAPSTTSSLKFDDIVPRDTSTRHVAAAGFYHCLVLATKDLLRVKQQDHYGNIMINVR